MCEASRNAKRQKIRVSQSCADPSVRHEKVLRNSVAAVGGDPRRASAAAADGVPTLLTRAAAASVAAAGAALRRHPVLTVTEVTSGVT